jgi:hypothetical protein
LEDQSESLEDREIVGPYTHARTCCLIDASALLWEQDFTDPGIPKLSQWMHWISQEIDRFAVAEMVRACCFKIAILIITCVYFVPVYIVAHVANAQCSGLPCMKVITQEHHLLPSLLPLLPLLA